MSDSVPLTDSEICQALDWLDEQIAWHQREFETSGYYAKIEQPELLPYPSQVAIEFRPVLDYQDGSWDDPLEEAP